MSGDSENIKSNIHSFRRKYYTNLLIRGALLSITILIFYFLIAALFEYWFWLSPLGRFVIILFFFAIAAYCLYRFLKEPLQYWIAKKGLGDEQSARLIGNYFPAIKDRLVNLIQLISLKDQSELAYASIQQKSIAFEPFRFGSAINLKDNLRYIKFLALPIALILILLLVNQSILIQSTHRIVHFNKEFVPQAPFAFEVGSGLTGYFNEDLTVDLNLDGQAVPDACYILFGTQRAKMESLGEGSFRFTFERLQQSETVQFEAAGFYSQRFQIILAHRPELTQLNLSLEYPRYLQRKSEQLRNAGSLEIPEGTVATWDIRTANALKAYMSFSSEEQISPLQSADNQHFIYRKVFKDPDQYEIILENEHSKNKEQISYRIEVIKDQYPQIQVNSFRDSVLYQRIILGGVVSDDYGLSQLQLKFHVKDSRQQTRVQKSTVIPITPGQSQQSFYWNWGLDSIKLQPGESLEYYLQVWDNDGVNGHKSSRSSVFTLYVPDKEKLATNISTSQSQTEQQFEETAKKASELRNQIDEAQQKLKGKQSLDWQDKKQLEDILEQKKELEQLINKLSEQNRLLEEKKDAFTEQDERIREKAEQIQKLMDELLDEETKKLLRELEELLKQNTDVNQLRQLMDKLNKNSMNIEKELERTLELFKQLQFEYKIDQAVKDLQKNIEDQKELLEKTESLEKEMDKSEKGINQENVKEKSSELSKEQQKVAEDFKKTEEKLEELRNLGEELDQEEDVPSEDQSQEIEDSQQESQDNLENNSPSQSKAPQKKAIQKMQEMQQQMETMQSSMTMEMDMQNIESLRQILHGLIKLSHNQEDLMKQFSELQQSDPRFNVLAQQQLKIKDDVKVLEDSLLELGKRDPLMGSFVTREVTELNDRLDKTIDAYRERRRPQVATEMQFAMTSINNLALMLDSHFDMLMNMMANAKATGKKSKQKGNQPNLSMMQQQLNDKIEQLKNSGKGGRELSEELAEMAAEQERIRRALQEMEQKIRENGGQVPGNDLSENMEDTEIDLVNKRLTEQLIQRQREILTRLLETEKSLREQEMDEERKGESAKDYTKEMPDAIQEYLQQKEKEVELLRTVPPKLYPYYRKEVNEYFKRLREN